MHARRLLVGHSFVDPSLVLFVTTVRRRTSGSLLLRWLCRKFSGVYIWIYATARSVLGLLSSTTATPTRDASTFYLQLQWDARTGHLLG